MQRNQCLDAEQVYRHQLAELRHISSEEESSSKPGDADSSAAKRLMSAREQVDELLEQDLVGCTDRGGGPNLEQRTASFLQEAQALSVAGQALSVAAEDASDQLTVEQLTKQANALAPRIAKAREELAAAPGMDGTAAYLALKHAVSRAQAVADSEEMDELLDKVAQTRRSYLNKRVHADADRDDLSLETDTEVTQATSRFDEAARARSTELEAVSNSLEDALLGLTEAENALELDSLLAGSVAGWDVGIAVIDLESGRQIYSYNADQLFPTASTYKVYVMYDMMKKIMSGQLTWDDTIDGYPLEYCQEEMILRSENACSEAWLHQYGYDHVEEVAHQLGSTSTTFEPGEIYTNATDLANFMKKLYQGEGLDKENQELFIELLETQHYRNGMPSGLAGSAVVADKIGFLPGYRHDAGIVYGDKGNYVIAILTNNMGNPQIASISRIIYDWL